MKKIFITILLVLIPLNVQAINNQKTFSETKLCKYYKETKVFTNYTIEGENPKEYPFKSNEQIIKKYETEIKPEEKPNRIIQEETYNNYNPIKKINRIVTRYDMVGLVYELEIYEKDQKLDYTLSSNNDNQYKHINDNQLNLYDKINLNFIDINLSHEVNPLDITVKIYLRRYFDTLDIYTYLFPKEYTKKFNVIEIKKEYDYINNSKKITFEDDYEVRPYEIKITQEDIKTYKYSDEIITTQEELETPLYNKLPSTTKYKYQDTLFKYYKIEKEYQEGYHKTLDGYIKDETKCINSFPEQKNNIFEKIPVTKKLQASIKADTKEEKTDKETITNTSNLLVYKKQINTKKENNLSHKESKKKTKTNKILYILPVIILSIIFLLGYLLYNLLKER